jgi:tetratricopeptide (TPR) repeat protein
MSRSLATLLLFLLLLPACATYRSGLKDAAVTAAPSTGITFEQASDIWSADRGSKKGVKRAIDALQVVVAAEPDHQEALTLLSRALYLMADGYVADEEERIALFEEGVTQGERAMACDAEFRAAVDRGEKPIDAVFVLQKDDQMAIYWTAANLGRWARLKGWATVSKYKGYVGQLMTHCSDLDETAFYGGPSRYWGAFYAVTHPSAGGDLDMSREMFEKARTMYPENFTTYVLYAETYALKIGDRELFRDLLEHVLNTPSDVLPEMIPEQDVEKKKARDFLDRVDTLFKDLD